MSAPREPQDPALKYDESYYRRYSLGDPPYLPGEQHWESFFGLIAGTIVAELSPRRVLDAGCGVGFLVHALRHLGVDAWGIDVSEFAISRVPEEIKPYCKVASVTDKLGERYDLVLCVEVLEHLADAVAQRAVANLCDRTDRILFSSTPDDFADPTHENVRRSEYWVELFARWGMFRDVDFEAGFLSRQAILFRRTGATTATVARSYERWRERADEEIASLRAERSQYEDRAREAHDLRDQVASVATTARSLADAQDQLERAQGEIERLSELAAARSAMLSEAEARAGHAEAELEALHRTRTMRYTRAARSAYARLRGDA